MSKASDFVEYDIMLKDVDKYQLSPEKTLQSEKYITIPLFSYPKFTQGTRTMYLNFINIDKHKVLCLSLTQKVKRGI